MWTLWLFIMCVSVVCLPPSLVPPSTSSTLPSSATQTSQQANWRPSSGMKMSNLFCKKQRKACKVHSYRSCLDQSDKTCLNCHVTSFLFLLHHNKESIVKLGKSRQVQILIVSRLMAQGTSLQEVDLGHNNLAEVSPDILAPGVNMIQVRHGPNNENTT